MTLRYLAVPALILAAILGACSNDDEEATPDGGDTSEPTETVEVEMTIEDFSFEPAVIDAGLGDEVFVEIANDGEVEHTFTVSEFFVDETLESGQDMDVTFVANDPGDFTFFCRNHPDMQGTLRVTRDGEVADPSPTEDNDTEGGGAGIGY
jgi:plastocyanin